MLAALLTLAVIPAAQAFYPASGFYWNPGVPGRGYAIEVQDNQIFVAVYAYDDARIAFWYTAQGTLIGDSLYEGQLDVVDGGTCPGCSFTAPSVDLGAGGPFVLQFLDKERAQLNWDGGIENLERFNFALGDVHARMLGEWTLMLDFASQRGDSFPYDGEVLVFDGFAGSGNEETFVGCRPDDSQAGFCSQFALDNHDAAGLFDAQNGEYVIVVGDAPGLFLAYFLDIGLDRATGFAQSYASGSNPSGPMFPVRGYRSASRSFVQTGTGPAKSSERSDPGAKDTGSARDGLISRHPEMLAEQGMQVDPHRQMLVSLLIRHLTE
jgi:hypothetical protein